jgi:hypothetical protein
MQFGVKVYLSNKFIVAIRTRPKYHWQWAILKPPYLILVLSILLEQAKSPVPQPCKFHKMFSGVQDVLLQFRNLSFDRVCAVGHSQVGKTRSQILFGHDIPTLQIYLSMIFTPQAWFFFSRTHYSSTVPT